MHTRHIVGACRLRSNPVNVDFVEVGGSIQVASDGFSASGVTLRSKELVSSNSFSSEALL